MIPKRFIYPIALLLTLSACASGPGKLTQTEFRTKITESGLKHFELSITPGSYLNKKIRPSRNIRDPLKRKKKLTASLINISNQHIENNQFCNSGFWVLETQTFSPRIRLRGECNELATLKNRQDFPDTVIEW